MPDPAAGQPVDKLPVPADNAAGAAVLGSNAMAAAATAVSSGQGLVHLSMQPKALAGE
jgi:hypothetical protein